MQVGAGAAAMHRNPAPGAEMVSQCLYGEPVLVHHHEGEFALAQALTDRYVGWVLQADLSAQILPVTHRVRALRAHIYTEASIKAPPLRVVSLGAQIASDGVREGRFLKCRAGGWVIEDQLLPVDAYETDPAAAAQRYLNTPYLWGGRDSLGIDCSGLVQQGFAACGISLPRDSDMQGAWAGAALADWQTPGVLARNDLVFWNGHVGIMLDAETLLHANAHHMAVAAESLPEAIRRIASTYGQPTGARRVDLSSAAGQNPDWLEL